MWEVKKWDGQKQEDVRSGEALDVLQLKRSSDGCVTVEVQEA